MCRLLTYFGMPAVLEELLYEQEHSLIIQSYKPQEMISGTVNADGFGIGWYHPQKGTKPSFIKVPTLFGTMLISQASAAI